MKIDRLLSIIMYLLNRETASARQLADRFNCSVRTIQRDMVTIELAGLPIFTIQGPEGGYGIMETYKMDRKLMTEDDLYFIIAALSGIESSLTNPRLSGTLEKMRGLVPDGQARSLHESRGKLFLDFSMMGGGARLKPMLAILEKAIETERLVSFTYTSTKLETCTRTVEPMTIVFKWRSWYLYGFCRLKSDYRIFRADRIMDLRLLPGKFTRRGKSLEEFFGGQGSQIWGKAVRVRLRFDPRMKPFIIPLSLEDTIETDKDGFLILSTSLPDDGGMFGYILSFGKMVEVLHPPAVRQAILGEAEEIASIYKET